MGVLIFMLSSVVPMFKEIFLRFDKELPPFTQSVLDLSDWFKSYGLFMFLLIIVLFFVVFSQRKKLVFRKYSADVVLKIPIVGGLVRKVYLARLCQSMALLISSKVPLIRTLELMQGIISYYPLELALSNIIRRVEKGESLANSMQEHDVFDKKMVTLIRVAEETNSLDKMLSRLANQYNESIEHSSSTIGTLIEPIMILLVGLIVGIILVAMYQPLFNIGNILE
jgi:type IV pilus assembly protein PilC